MAGPERVRASGRGYERPTGRTGPRGDGRQSTPTAISFDPYALTPHARELLDRRVMLAPVVVVWRYRVANPAAFRDWIGMKEILLSQARMSKDTEVAGVRYGGTYRVADSAGGATFTTLWGYTSEAAMNAMHKLATDSATSATLVQLELIDFIKGLKAFVTEAGDAHFAQETLIAAAVTQDP